MVDFSQETETCTSYLDCIGQSINIGDWVITPTGSSSGMVQITQVTHLTRKNIKIVPKNKHSHVRYVNPKYCYKIPPEHATLYVLKNK